MLKAIHAQESREAADRKAQAIVTDLRAAKMNKAADLVEHSIHDTLTYYAFPDIHWQKIRTNNPLERIMRNSPANTCGGSISRWPVLPELGCSTTASHRRHGMVSKRYMNMRPLYQQQVLETGAALA